MRALSPSISMRMVSYIMCSMCTREPTPLRVGCGESPPEEITAAAAALGITVTSHDALMTRINAAIASVDAVLDQAKQEGRLTFINEAYRSARISGAPMPRYGLIYRRIRNVILKRIASGRTIEAFDKTLIDEALNGASNKHAESGDPPGW